MSTNPPTHLESISKQQLRIGIVASQYNASFVDAMVDQAQQELSILAPNATIDIIRVPGAFEIPLLVKLLAERHHPDAILALGVILRGATAHADLIASAISQHLLRISLDYSLPVIHEVLLLDHEMQALERCLQEPLNRGIEAARAALATVQAASTIYSL